MHKKLIALTLALALVLSMGTMALASTATDTGTVSWTVVAADVSIAVSSPNIGNIKIGEWGSEMVAVKNNSPLVAVTITEVAGGVPTGDPDQDVIEATVEGCDVVVQYAGVYGVVIAAAGGELAAINVAVFAAPGAAPGARTLDITVVATVYVAP